MPAFMQHQLTIENVEKSQEADQSVNGDEDAHETVQYAESQAARVNEEAKAVQEEVMPFVVKI